MTDRKIDAMADDQSWVGLDYWERVRWARQRWQRQSGAIETARAAAESLAMKEDTYSAYERRPDSSKHTKLNDQAAIRFARKFGVRWEWLLTGEGEPTLPEPEPTPPMKRALNVMRLVPEDQQEAIADAIEALARAGRRA